MAAVMKTADQALAHPWKGRDILLFVTKGKRIHANMDMLQRGRLGWEGGLACRLRRGAMESTLSRGQLLRTVLNRQMAGAMAQ